MSLYRNLKMLLPFVSILLCAVLHVHGLGKTILDGDVFIEFIGAIYVEPGKDYNSPCSIIETETVQNMQAIKWTLSKLNEENFIPNVNIGLRVSQTCKKEGEAENLALQLAAELYNNNQQESRIVGVIGSDYSTETEAISRLLSSLPEEHRILQLSYSSTSSSLRDRDVYKNFFRTIPPDDLQVEVMIGFLKALNWTYMAIIYDDDSYGRGGKDELLARSKGLDVCFPVLISVDTAQSSVSKLEADIRDKIVGADIPITGVLVFGSSILADQVLTAAKEVIENNPDFVRPVFLFSEAGGYIQGQHTNISKGAFVLSPPIRKISLFQDEWRNIFTDHTNLYLETELNTWIRDVYKEKFNCTLAETKDNNTCSQLSVSEFEDAVPESAYNQYAIQATMIIAKVVKNVLDRACPKNELCARFLDTWKTRGVEFIKELSMIQAINFDNFGTFRDIKEFRDPDLIVNFKDSCEIKLIGVFPEYEVYSHQLCQTETERTCLFKAAEYKKSKELQIISTNIKDYGINGEELLWPNIRKAQCPDGSFCPLCFAELSEDSVLFIPGDMYVVGIVPVHSKGPTPLQCGDMKKGGLDIVETIRFAVAEAKTKPAAKIGIIIIDSCNDPQIIQEKILTLHRHGVYIDGQYIFVGDKILGYIGGWISDVTIAVAEITSRLQFPQISYASTAPVLSKRELFPYFLRVPSPDEKQAKTILRLVQAVGGDFIQIVYSAGAYGEGGRDHLFDLISASDLDICVAQTLSVTTNSDGAAVLSKLRRFGHAKIVVLFIGSFEIVHMLGAFNMIDKNEFLFISSEGWGTRFDVTKYTNLIGSITVTSRLAINEKLKDHMELLSPVHSQENPWIRSYIEKEFDCYFEWSYDKTSRKKCQENSSLNVYTTDFRLDAWTPFAERAVTALLAGVEKVLRDKCDGNTAVLCDTYRKNISDVFEAIKRVQLRGTNGFDTRIFDDNGDGIADFQIYVVALEPGRQYIQVGDSSFGVDNEQAVLAFQKAVFESVQGDIVHSMCSKNIDKCNQCFPEMLEKDEGIGLSTGVMVAIVVLSAVCFVLAGMLLVTCCRLGFCLTIENGQVKLNDTYITPIYDRKKRDLRADIVSLKYTEDNYDSIPGVHETPKGRPQLSQGITSIDNEAFSERVSERGVETRNEPSVDQDASELELGQRKDSYLELGSRKDSYLNSDLNLKEHLFDKFLPLPAIPSETV